MSCRHGLLRLVIVLFACTPGVARADAYFRTYNDAVVHWAEDRIEVGVDPRLLVRFGPGFMTILQAAADSWGVSPKVPIFEIETPDPSKPALPTPRVWVGIGEQVLFDRELAITLTTTDAGNGEVLHAKIWLNPKTPWAVLLEQADSEANTYDLQGVLTHEFGHVLGLNEDDERPLATMHPQFRRGEVHQRSLEASDEEAVSALYQRVGQGSASGCAVSVVPAPGSTYASIFVAFFVFGLARFRSLLWRVSWRW